MDIGKIEVEIEGMSPLLMNYCNPEDLIKSPKRKTQNYDMEKIANRHAYWSSNGKKDKTI